MTKKQFAKRLESLGYNFSTMSDEHKEIINDCYTVQNTKREKTDLYSRLIDMYFKWMTKVKGITPKIDGAEGKSLKSIITYLRSNTKDDEEAYQSMRIIFVRWDKLDPFHQKQLKLSQINSNLVNILNTLKNGQQTNNNKQAGISDNYVQELRKRMES